MRIKEDLCNGCERCIIICPTNAISLVKKKAVINRDLCVECNVCYRDAECPVNAIRPERLKWPRIIRNPFSCVIKAHKLTGIPGRGTEEMKTNDLTGRFKIGEIGISIELGRPGVSTKLSNIELFTEKLAKIGAEFEKDSPVTALLIDDQGHINEELKEERVISAFIEFKIPYELFPQVSKIIRDVDKMIDTVFTVGIISRIEDNDTTSILNLINQHGFSAASNAKVNIGLGKPIV
ncbi:MAG: indolepyruvate ferredoxin oxidoreductase subunit alpha [Candidatus Hodarchaeota archaeon]